MKVCWSKSLNSPTENSEDEISTTNREATCLLLFVQTLVTHKPEYSQRADVRQPKQETPFGLIRVSWLVLIFSSFYKQRFRSYFYNFTLKEFSYPLTWLNWSYLIILWRHILYVVKEGKKYKFTCLRVHESDAHHYMLSKKWGEQPVWTMVVICWLL